MPSPAILPKASRWDVWARQRSSPISPASWLRSRAPTSPAPPSTSMAAAHRWCSTQERPPFPEAFSLSNRVLGGLDRPSPHDLARRLGLEHHFFAREGVGALASLGRGLLDHDELGEAGDEEHPVLLQLLVADV